MNTKSICMAALLAGSGLSGLAGCATPAGNGEVQEAREEPVYQTGSNIPRRGAAGSNIKLVNKEDILNKPPLTGDPAGLGK